jgi:hypothetical protein
VSEIPGVTVVGLATELPPDRSGSYDNFNLVSRPVPAGRAEPQVPWYYVSPGYFGALGIGLVEGRSFLPADTADAFPVVIVSRSWARHYLGDTPAVGQQLIQGGCYDCPRTTIIGVVEDIRNLGPSLPSDAVYGPLTQAAPRSMYLVSRVRGSGAAVASQLSEAIRGLDPELPLTTASLSSRLDTSLADPRRWATALGAFSAVGLALASIGIFGLMAYTVRQRRREIGVRLALGADPAGITRRMVLRGLSYATIGSAIGMFLALLITDRTQSLLYGVGPRDAGTYVLVGTVLLASAALASWFPARRAARVGPLEAIAAE